MLRGIKRLFDDLLMSGAVPASAEEQEHRMRLATAVLLMEMVNADFDIQDDEVEHVRELLAREFSLTPHEARELAELGREEMHDAVSMHEYTRTLDTMLTPGDKIRVIEMLWHIAYVDGKLDKYEEHLLRKIADLLHVSHRQLIQAKLRVLEGK